MRAARPIEAEPDDASMAAARWAFEHGRPTGSGTDTLPSAAWQFRPMRTARGVVGLVGLQPAGGAAALDPERDRALSALLDQAAVAHRACRADGGAGARRRPGGDRGAADRAAHLPRPRPEDAADLHPRRRRDAAGQRRPRCRRRRAPTCWRRLIEEDRAPERFLANILDMVRIENGQIEPRREPVDLTEAVETRPPSGPRASRAAASGATSPARLPAPRLDPALLDQVLGNLLDNALKFSGPAGQVAGAAPGGRGRRWRSSSRTTDPASRPPTCTASSTRSSARAAPTASPRARGLGLAICRGLVARHGRADRGGKPHQGRARHPHDAQVPGMSDAGPASWSWTTSRRSIASSARRWRPPATRRCGPRRRRRGCGSRRERSPAAGAARPWLARHGRPAGDPAPARLQPRRRSSSSRRATRRRRRSRALDAGADDYVEKPFALGELLARMRVLRSRRATAPLDEPKSASCRSARWNSTSPAGSRGSTAASRCSLTPREWDLLAALAQRRRAAW